MWGVGTSGRDDRPKLQLSRWDLIFLVPAVLLSVIAIFCLPSSSVSSVCFNLTIPMRKSSGVPHFLPCRMNFIFSLSWDRLSFGWESC